MKRSFKYSIAIHVAVIAICYAKLPSFYDPLPPEKAISVSIVKTGSTTNLANLRTEEKAKDAKTVHEKPKALAPQEEAKIVPKPLEKKKSVQEKKTPAVANVQKKKPAEVKKIKSPAKQEQNEFDSLLNELDKKDYKAKKSDVASSSSAVYSADLPMTISEKDNIKYQIEQKFVNPVALEFKPGELVIKLRLEMNEGGNVVRVIELSGSKYRAEHERLFSVLRDSLIRATHMASPLQNLPIEKYHGSGGWSEIELSFDAYSLMNY